MTLRERYWACLADLVEERKAAVEGSWWAGRLDRQIDNLTAAMEEKYYG